MPLLRIAPMIFGVINGKRRAESAARVAGRRLDENPVEAAVAKNFAVGDAIQGDASGEA